MILQTAVSPVHPLGHKGELARGYLTHKLIALIPKLVSAIPGAKFGSTNDQHQQFSSAWFCF